MIPFNGLSIIPSAAYPKHPTRKYKAVFSGHPLITRLCWSIRRWIWIRPWIVAYYPDDADPIIIGNQMFCGQRTFQLIKLHCGGKP